MATTTQYNIGPMKTRFSIKPLVPQLIGPGIMGMARSFGAFASGPCGDKPTSL
jgi:hypothetical protein